MPFRTHVLVIANRTVGSPELLGALRYRSEQGPIHVTLLAPVTWAERQDAQRRVDEAVSRLEAQGIEAEGILGDSDPCAAVQEAWDPGRYDEVIVSTFEVGASRWMQIDLPHRVAKLTDSTVRHVESRPPAPPHIPAPPRERRGLLESIASLMRTATRGRAA